MNSEQVEQKAEETQGKSITQEEFIALVERAKTLDIYRPTWCPEMHYDLYRVCYLMVKEEVTAQGMNATNRKKLIMRLMNKHIEAARNELHAKAKIEHEKLKANETTKEVTSEQAQS